MVDLCYSDMFFDVNTNISYCVPAWPIYVPCDPTPADARFYSKYIRVFPHSPWPKGTPIDHCVKIIFNSLCEGIKRQVFHPPKSACLKCQLLIPTNF